MELTASAQWLNQTFAGFDSWLLNLLGELHQGPVGPFLQALSELLHVIGIKGIGLIILGALLLIWPKTRRCGIGIWLALFIGLLVTNLTIKPLVDRPRPYADASGPFYLLWQQAGAMVESAQSFPSGHTTAAMAAMTVIFWSFDKRYSWTAFLFAVLMGLSRCYLMVHYPSDVAGGLLVGFLAGTAAYLPVRFRRASKRP